MILRAVAGQPILIGPLLASADGAPLTAGAAVAVRRDGTDVGTPAGTLAHVTAGVWQYTPSAGETDCGILGLILTGTGALPVAVNVLTTRLPVQTAGVLPGVTAAAAGGLLLVGTGAGQINASGGRAPADVVMIAGSPSGATALDRSARTMVLGIVGAGATPTSIPTASLDPAAAVTDQFKGRVLAFDRDTVTVALRGQATDVTGSTAAGVLTVTALSTAPAATPVADTFVLV